MIKKPTQEQLAYGKNISKKIAVYQSYAETIKPIVSKYQLKALEEKSYFNKITGKRIVKLKYIYTMDDNDIDSYYNRVDELKIDAGFKDIQKGQCPYLIATNNQLNEEQKLINFGKKLFDISDDIYIIDEHRKKFLTLLNKLFLSAL